MKAVGCQGRQQRLSLVFAFTTANGLVLTSCRCPVGTVLTRATQGHNCSMCRTDSGGHNLRERVEELSNVCAVEHDVGPPGTP